MQRKVKEYLENKIAKIKYAQIVYEDIQLARAVIKKPGYGRKYELNVNVSEVQTQEQHLNKRFGRKRSKESKGDKEKENGRQT